MTIAFPRPDTRVLIKCDNESAQQQITLFHNEPLLLDSGQVLSDVKVAYHTYGAPQENATVVLHALTGDSAVHEWWSEFMGEERPLDPTKDYIVCSNILGGCAGTAGPSDFGQLEISLFDMARVGRALLEYLGVKKVRLIGPSMGGMLAYAWLIEHPDFVEKAVIIGAPARHSAWAIGWNTAARNAIKLAPGGSGLEVARQIAMLSYRTEKSYAATQAGLHHTGVPRITSYLEYQGAKLHHRFCERSYCTITKAMDDFQPSNEALAAVNVPVLVVGISSDVLYPATEVKSCAALLPKSQYWELDSIHGHDAFLMDSQELPAKVSSFLRD